MYSRLAHLKSVFLKRRPLQLTFFVTRRCNFRCPFCFYLKATKKEQGGPELSLQEISRVAASMGDLLWVLFSGGEVFLREDLADISAVFHDVNHAALLTYPTNGSLPDVIFEKTKEILGRCKKSLVVIKLSLDGVGQAHDALRQMPGSFEKLMATYEKLARLRERHPNLELGVNTLFCSETQDGLEGKGGLVEFVRNLDRIDSHTISMVRGDLEDPHYKDIDLGKYERLIRTLESRLACSEAPFHRFRGGRLKAVQDVLQRRLIHATMSRGRRLVPCYAGRLNLVLTERGELYPCEMSQESFGNLRQAGYDVRRLLGSARGKEILERIARGGCYCSHECYFLTNIFFNPRMYPALLRDYIRFGLGSRKRQERILGRDPLLGLPALSARAPVAGSRGIKRGVNP